MDMSQDPYWCFLHQQQKALQTELDRALGRHNTQRRQELKVQIEVIKQAKRACHKDGPTHVEYGLY